MLLLLTSGGNSREGMRQAPPGRLRSRQPEAQPRPKFGEAPDVNAMGAQRLIHALRGRMSGEAEQWRAADDFAAGVAQQRIEASRILGEPSAGAAEPLSIGEGAVGN